MSLMNWLSSKSSGPRRIPINVTEAGFEPALVRVRSGEPVVLSITRRTARTCAREIVIDELGVHTPLPVGEKVEVPITVTSPGRLKFGCAMGKMISGVLEAS
jgi:plastocyanin domain-containing protein